MLAEYLKEGIAPRECRSPANSRPDHIEQLHAAKPGVVLPIGGSLVNDDLDDGFLGEVPLIIALVICLSAVTKQPAEYPKAYAGILIAEQTYCLVPRFFRMGMLKVFSATSIMVE